MKIARFASILSVFLIAAAHGDVFQIMCVKQCSAIDVVRLEKLRKREMEAHEAVVDGGDPHWVNAHELVDALTEPVPGVGKVVYFLKVFINKETDLDGYRPGMVHILLAMEFDELNRFVRGVAFPLEFAGFSPAEQMLPIVPDKPTFPDFTSVSFLGRPKARYTVEGLIDYFVLRIK